MLSILPIFISLVTLLSCVCDSHWFIDVLDDEAYTAVKHMLGKSDPGSYVIRLDEPSYREYVLPGNRHFKSVVLYVDLDNPDHLIILDIYRLAVRRLHEDAGDYPDETVNVFSTPTFFFYLDVSGDECDWILYVHRIEYVPELLRFGSGRSVVGHRKFLTDSLNRWLQTNTPVLRSWTPEEMFDFMINFFVLPYPSRDESPISTTRALLLSLMSLVVFNIWTMLLVFIAFLIGIYAIIYRPPWLFLTASLTLYAVSFTCLISAIVSSRRYSVMVTDCPLYNPKCLIRRLFAASSKSQFLHEGALVQLLFLCLSGLLFALTKCVVYGYNKLSLTVILPTMIAILAFLFHIFDYKELPYSLEMIPSAPLPRGSIDNDRNYVF
ncbi:uncharacterized protein BXIN_2997 [Babesia sp. Xinjiang]|uniref:uncharacterized protein n=1 Tax=Babesia sp. Xinjiang TaxID=462227 RepID=UPI000A22C9C6|nr:uncharacterized protein BXIN_2997 [Babesia sp. Xinjiang]ORM39435.1 hypothetical protein BXIN_2997 [Babesia sp. Xinjiang]